MALTIGSQNLTLRKFKKPVSAEALKKISERGLALVDWTMPGMMIFVLDIQYESFLVATRQIQRMSQIQFPLIGLVFAGMFYHLARLLIEQFRAARSG